MSQVEPGQEPTTPQESQAAVETFDRDYVESLRREAAGYRTKAREYEQVFDGYEPEVRDGWLELIKAAKEAPDDPELQAQLAEMLGLQMPEAPETNGYLTREEAAELARREARALLDEDRRARSEADAITNVQTTAKGLGYSVDSPDYVLLLKFANDMEAPDLNAAHQKVQEWKQAEWDRFVAEKNAEQQSTPVIPGNGAPPATTQTPRGWAEARDALHERLSRLGQ